MDDMDSGSNVPSRRVNDSKLDEVLDRLKALEMGQETMVANQVAHITEYHADLEPGEAATLVGEHIELKDNVTVLLDIVAGRKVVDPITHQWMGQREEGMRSMVERMDRQIKKFTSDTSNGGDGVRAKIRMTDAVKIAMLTSVATIIAAMLAAWAVVASGGSI